MKKVLFLALAAAAVMSCSESEEIENAGQKAEIKLGTVVGNTTRATVTDLPELQKVGFTVYAYNTGATTMASVATFDAMKEFMAAVKVTYSAPDWSLTGETYYWPMTDNLQFFAYGNQINLQRKGKCIQPIIENRTVCGGLEGTAKRAERVRKKYFFG